MADKCIFQPLYKCTFVQMDFLAWSATWSALGNTLITSSVLGRFATILRRKKSINVKQFSTFYSKPAQRDHQKWGGLRRLGPPQHRCLAELRSPAEQKYLMFYNLQTMKYKNFTCIAKKKRKNITTLTFLIANSSCSSSTSRNCRINLSNKC